MQEVKDYLYGAFEIPVFSGGVPDLFTTAALLANGMIKHVWRSRCSPHLHI
jgi:hypothetical protein